MSNVSPRVVAVVALWLLTAAFPVMGQVPPEQQPQPTTPGGPPEPPPRRDVTEPPPPVEAPPEARPTPTPEEPIPAGPAGSAPFFVGADLFNPPAHRGWITLTPSIAIQAEYNDNLDSTSRDKIDDVIVNIIPGFILSMQRPEYRLLAGYNFSAAFYANETERNEPFERQQLFVDAFYRFSPRVSFALGDRFIYDQETSVVSPGRISAGTRDSYRNTLAPRLDLQTGPVTTLSLLASYTLLRFGGDDSDAQDSDNYRAGLAMEHRFTPRFVGILGAGVAYLEPEEDPATTTVTPRIGFEYQLTPTLRAFANGGPTFIDVDGDRFIRPAFQVGIDQDFRLGTLRIGYDRAVTSETVGVTDRQIAYATFRVLTLRRGLELSVTPQYTHADTEDLGDDRVIDTYSVNLGASYVLGRGFRLFAAYTFFAQRERGTGEIDQNRVTFGLQYAYPINFE
jgi:hypothetical protein